MGPPHFNSVHEVRSSLVFCRHKDARFQLGPRLCFAPDPQASRLATAYRLLEEAGLSNPNDLKARFSLPQGTWTLITLPSASANPGTAPEPTALKPLHAALLLGLCGVSLYSPNRPVIWSEARLSREVFLIQPSSFYRPRP